MPRLLVLSDDTFRPSRSQEHMSRAMCLGTPSDGVFERERVAVPIQVDGRTQSEYRRSRGRSAGVCQRVRVEDAAVVPIVLGSLDPASEQPACAGSRERSHERVPFSSRVNIKYSRPYPSICPTLSGLGVLKEVATPTQLHPAVNSPSLKFASRLTVVDRPLEALELSSDYPGLSFVDSVE